MKAVFKNWFLLLVSLMVLVAACGDGDTEPTVIATSTVPSMSLEESAESFYAALEVGDFGATEGLVDEAGLLVLTAIESNSAGALELTDETRSQVRENFWSSFVETASEFQAGASGVNVVEGQLLTAAGESFQVVVVSDAANLSEATWVFHEIASGWEVDPIATFGSSFAGPVETWLNGLPPGEQGEALASVAEHLPSWNALLALQGDDESGVAVRAILQRLIPRLEVAGAEPTG